MNKNDISWIHSAPFAATVCDTKGTVLYMNEHARTVFTAEGGERLIGTNLLDCHPEPARTKLRGMLENGEANIYTIEKRGIRKLIYQVPWREGDHYRGFIELSMEIPMDMPHFVRS